MIDSNLTNKKIVILCNNKNKKNKIITADDIRYLIQLGNGKRKRNPKKRGNPSKRPTTTHRHIISMLVVFSRSNFAFVVPILYITLDGNFSYDGPTVLRRGNVPLAVIGIASVQPNPISSSTKLVVASTE